MEIKMPKREDINKILIIGSGPIMIGQACEFDYSGTQACKALREMGYEIVLVNSNPATIMTDPDMADKTYIEPLNAKRIEQIIEKENPDALLPNLGGQSALNLCAELEKGGVLKKHDIRVIGVRPDAITRGENRIEFKNTVAELGIEMPQSAVAYSVEEAVKVAERLEYPVVLRPAYTMGGFGGGLVYNVEELREVALRGLSVSLVGQVLVEKALLGWNELEIEVIRDSKNNMITACFIENIDPLGIHTGDSVCTVPMLTVSREAKEKMQEYAYKIVEKIGIVGGTNLQFAYDRKNEKVLVIEINPRTSRSSALASKATGCPIARISAKLAVGMNLDEIPCGKCGTLDKYTPSDDHVVVKFPNWEFDKFKDVRDSLNTQMSSVGETMSMGKTFKEALQKAVRSLDDENQGLGMRENLKNKTREELVSAASEPTSTRLFVIYEALRKGASVDEIAEMTNISKFFIEQIKELADEETKLLKYSGRIPSDAVISRAKKDGFSDKYIGMLIKLPEDEVREARIEMEITESWEKVHVTGTEKSAYYYSTYNSDAPAEISDKKKVIIIGGGPNRIGQGIEFDYCCVHAALALKKAGYETIIINCNPETVSTDYDIADKLYVEPLTVENVLSIYEIEKPIGVIAQLGGQIPLNIAAELEKNGVKILGTPPEVINMAEDRDLFKKMMQKIDIPVPESGVAGDVDEALIVAEKVGYPVMVRHSYMLGGRGMEIIHDMDEMEEYMNSAKGVAPNRPILIDRFLNHAAECEIDAVCDGQNAYIPAVMEHIELAGVHSGDSAAIVPAKYISAENIEKLKAYTKKIAKELGVVGLMNVKYAIEDDKIYVLDANLRASRTVPLISKVTGINMTRFATRVIVGEKPKLSQIENRPINHYGVKEAVFPWRTFVQCDPLLGPEMHSTGEVLGIADTVGEAFCKAQEATQTELPAEGRVFISVSDIDKPEVVPIARDFADAGFEILATGGTYKTITDAGIKAKYVKKVQEGRPNILDEIINGKIQMVVNTPAGRAAEVDDSYIRKAAVKAGISYETTMPAAKIAASGIKETCDKKTLPVKSLQELTKE